MKRTRRRAIALLCTVAFLPGCFRYVPTRLATVPVGEEVQVHLSPRAQIELSERRGRRIDEVVRGTLAERGDDQLLLRIPVAAERNGFFRADIQQDLPLAVADVVGIDMRQFSPSRTALLVGGSVAGAALLVVTIISASRGGGPPGPGGPEEIRIPLFSVPSR